MSAAVTNQVRPVSQVTVETVEMRRRKTVSHSPNPLTMTERVRSTNSD